MIARKELSELERWRTRHNEYRRWLAEFPAIGLTLDNLLVEVQGKHTREVCHPPGEVGPWDVAGLRYNLRFNQGKMAQSIHK